MGFKMKGSPAKTGGIQGTSGHASALKKLAEEQEASALKHWNHPDPDADHTSADHLKENIIEPVKKKVKKAAKKVVSKVRDIASGKILRSKADKEEKMEKDSKERRKTTSKKTATKYTKADLKNLSFGSKERIQAYKDLNWAQDHTTTGHKNYKGDTEKKDVKVDDTKKDTDSKKLTTEAKTVEDEKIKSAKLKKLEAKKEIADIKSGRDDEYTGTRLSRTIHKVRSKRLSRKIEREETGVTKKEQKRKNRLTKKEERLTKKLEKVKSKRTDSEKVKSKRTGSDLTSSSYKNLPNTPAGDQERKRRDKEAEADYIRVHGEKPVKK
tara:strand:- start:874 stop:1848 length:975 start_codon:yes stop_codon:yes gene_type:complete